MTYYTSTPEAILFALVTFLAFILLILLVVLGIRKARKTLQERSLTLQPPQPTPQSNNTK